MRTPPRSNIMARVFGGAVAPGGAGGIPDGRDKGASVPAAAGGDTAAVEEDEDEKDDENEDGDEDNRRGFVLEVKVKGVTSTHQPREMTKQFVVIFRWARKNKKSSHSVIK